MLNTSTSMISDVIGTNIQSAAFVYGLYSFVDKIANGLFLFWLIANYSTDAFALQTCISAIPAICSVLCALLSLLMSSVEISDSPVEIDELNLSRSPLGLKSPFPRWNPLNVSR